MTKNAINRNFRDSRYYQVSKIPIPEIFFRRFKVGIPILDSLLGSGFLPGSTFTIDAAPGVGKTTLMLMMLESLFKIQNKKPGYVSGEESKEQLAYNCKRLGIKHVIVANKTDIDEVVRDIKDNQFDILIIDSFQCMKSLKTKGKTATQLYIVNAILKAAQENECVVGFIMHRTKDGKLKGDSTIPHAVDMNMTLEFGDFAEERLLRVSKNRFGSVGEIPLYMGPSGYEFEHDFGQRDVAAAPTRGRRPDSGKSKEMEQLLQIAGDKKQKLTLGVATELTGNFYRGRNMLKELETLNKLHKVGRGGAAYWEIN